MAPITPRASKILKAKKDGTPSSSQKKLKQSSLLSFFSKKKPDTKINSTNDNASANTTAIGSSPIASKPVAVNDIPPVISSFVPLSANNDTTMVEQSKSKIKTDPNNSISLDIDSDDEMDTTFENKTKKSTTTNNSGRSKRTINYAESDDDDLPLNSTTQRNKKSRLFTEDSDSDEYVPTKKEMSNDIEDDDDDDFIETKGSAINELADDASDSENDDDLLSLSESKPKPKPISRSKTPTLTKKTTLPSRANLTTTTTKNKNFNKSNEERYSWLVDEKDMQGRSPNDPEYDPRTLYIPDNAWNKFTAFEKQYWEIKSKMWDCIVFFKKGKFFELYEKDAFLANNLFDWKLAGNGRANMQLAGIPEMSFEYWAAQFIELGYKVAKVDQVESMLAKEMREGTKGIVKRELECVLTSGTLTDGDMIQTDLATYCLAIKEESGNFYDINGVNSHNPVATSISNRIFGVAFIDTSTGELQMTEFVDDNECSKLDTIISQIKPKEIIIERNNLSSLANKIVKFNASPNAIYNVIKPEKEFYTFDKTYDILISNENDIFEDESKWPKVLQDYHKEGKQVGFTAFGGLLYYLNWLKLDKTLLSMGNIREYNPVKLHNSLILDGITLQNLEIFSNTFDGSDKGTLFRLFNKAITPMGKRMMRQWLMRPLYDKKEIEERLNTVDLLMSNTEIRSILEANLVKLPDLERMLSRVHSCTVKVKDFEKVITGFEDIIKLLNSLKNELDGDIKSTALGKYIQHIPASLKDDVNKWSNAFDRKKAIMENIIIPQRGVEPDFDKSVDEMDSIESELQELLKQYKKQFKCSSIAFKHSGKETYTVEIPINATKNVPSNWIQMGANKSAKRYYSDELKTLARCMTEARESHKILEEDLKKRLCLKFDENYKKTWMPTIKIISQIDCLIALTRTSESIGYPSCRPEFVDEMDAETGNKLNGFVKFQSLRHPCFNEGTTVIREFIPNDIELGGNQPQLGLLTGANAAGKSTILRITCIAVIMAQMGCYVPCETAKLSPIDRIMTRLGANDNIMQGKSTFFVELSETKKILDMATNRSLLVVDELGRGGSSSDGFAIAESVLYHVATHIQSLGFFATHYGTLGLQFIGHPQVRPMRMQILVDEGTRNVTFLYKLEDGASEGSFGMHVASMCNIPKSIVDGAEKAAMELENTSKLLKQLNNTEGISDKNIKVSDGLQSDLVRLLYGSGLNNDKTGTGEGVTNYDTNIKSNVLQNIFKLVDSIE
ncbi:DNA mismatch repair protein msh6 [Monosporozyma unispora]|nr:DNA mismatch repair protein msh6 [Kazachstania unispora]